MADTYRRIRNTARYLLANLDRFDPAVDCIPGADLLELDKWALAETVRLQEEIIRAYSDFQFHLIYQKLHHYCVVTLGGFYLDIIKDRMYTLQRDSLPRRSAQTAMCHIAEALVRWLAPVLSFTADEIWRHLPGARGESVFLEEWHRDFPEVKAAHCWPGITRGARRSQQGAGTPAHRGRHRFVPWTRRSSCTVTARSGTTWIIRR